MTTTAMPNLVTPCHGARIHVTTTYDVECSQDGCRNSWTPSGMADEGNKDTMTTTPNPLLIAKTTRLALQFLATDTMRPTVTSAVMELVMDDVSLASPKLRRQLMDEHLAALDWVFRDAYTSQAPTPTFIIDTDPVPKGVLAMEQIVEMLVAQNKKLEEIVNLLPAELVRAWDHGYFCGASDHMAEPIDEAYLGISNPYTLEKGDSTP